jgi:hypothetical protein
MTCPSHLTASQNNRIVFSRPNWNCYLGDKAARACSLLLTTLWCVLCVSGCGQQSFSFLIKIYVNIFWLLIWSHCFLCIGLATTRCNADEKSNHIPGEKIVPLSWNVSCSYLTVNTVCIQPISATALVSHCVDCGCLRAGAAGNVSADDRGGYSKQFHSVYLQKGNLTKKDRMGGGCSTHGREAWCV